MPGISCLRTFLGAGKSLVDIQREEAQRAIQERAASQAAGVSLASASGWAKVAAGTSGMR